MKSRLTKPADLGTALRWETLRAECLRNWGRAEAADNATRWAQHYFEQLQIRPEEELWQEAA